MNDIIDQIDDAITKVFLNESRQALFHKIQDRQMELSIHYKGFEIVPLYSFADELYYGDIQKADKRYESCCGMILEDMLIDGIHIIDQLETLDETELAKKEWDETESVSMRIVCI